MRKLVLGLDIGITSVGFGIIDISTGEVIDYGVRLFKESLAAANETRRERRGSKRLKRRRRQRLDDLKKILDKYNVIDEIKFNENPYFIRVKGLNEKITRNQLAIALYNIIKHRGSSFETVDDVKTSDDESTKKALYNNDLLLKNGKFICEIQLDRQINQGELRGHQNNFRTQDYVKEAIKILNNQDVSEDFKKEILELIERKREYFEGPGSSISPTPYGRYIDFNQEKPISLIEKMRGKCSIYKSELRAPKKSFSACLFNLLNDLNNLTINNEAKISTEQKNEIIEIIKRDGGITVSKLCKYLGVSVEDITGFRIDKKSKPILTEFDGYKSIIKAVDDREIYLSEELIDNISEILTKTKGIDERIELLRKLNSDLTGEMIERVARITGMSGYHSLSLKAIKELNEELINNPMNQMQIKSLIYNFNHTLDKYKGKKNIEADKEAILSPVAKRAQREALKVVNRLRELYGEFDSIIIETTRMKNTQEQKAKINDTQKYYEDQNKKCEDLLKQNNSNVKLTSKLREKIKLYEEQEAKTAYELKPIDFNLLINDPTMYEVDHIIPISVSLDDSINNKVLVTRSENQRKGNLTPLAAIDKNKLNISKKIYIDNVLTLKKKNSPYYNKKTEYLLFDRDITKFENMKDFINRNLVDTSYANRVVLNTLQNYFDANNINTKVHTIKGSATSAFRKRVKIEKNRDSEEVGYAHHAIDALIIASLKKFPKLDYYLSKYKGYEFIDNTTGEVLEVIDKKDFFESSFINFVSQLLSMEKDVVKFSHKIDTKANRQIADETIYSTRIVNDNEFVVKKYKNIYDPKDSTIANDIINGKCEKYLMYKNDINTFNKLIKIVNYYKQEYLEDSKTFDNKKNEFKINPFSIYLNENGAKIRKYAKNDNGPEINQMKYFDGKLGNHISISHNYNSKNKNVVLLQISPYRTDFYYSKEKGYKFVTIRYSDIRYSKKEQLNIIDKKWYEEEKIKKRIDEAFEFCFSMHRDELIKIVKSDENEEDISVVKFTATNNDNANTIEVKPINYYEKRQIIKAIGKKIKLLEKYTTDICGNLYKVGKQELKLKFK